MTSKIKVDNINKVSDDSNIIKKCGTTTTIGSGASNPIVVDGSSITLGRCGGTVALASGATQTGFGRTGTVDWQTAIKTGDFTAVSGEGYFVNTTSGAITMTLPASPSAGDIVSVKDYAYKFATNNLTVNRNGSPIGGGTDISTQIYQTDGDFLTFIYADATKGWLLTNDSANTDNTGASYIIASGGTVTCCGDYKIHTFTSPGTFCVSCAGNAAGNNQVEYLVVAGGGGGSGGSSNTRAPGGGAGGFRFASPSISPLTYPAKPLAGSTITVPASAIPITVGAGGAGSPGGNPGSNSIFSSIISTGGGSTDCQPGGSGAGAPGPNGAINTGSGNQPPVSPSQGKDGANTYDSGGAAQYGGAGGGALANGSTGPGAPAGGVGGGLPTAFGSNGEPSGSYRYYAGGAGGGGEAIGGASNGGLGGGGNGGGCSPSTPSTAGTANTGGGGGGGGSPSHVSGSSGGSGIVVIRYKFQN